MKKSKVKKWIEPTKRLTKYDDKLPLDRQKYVEVTKIIVPNNHSKQQLLAASEYIHDLQSIDTDFHAVNLLAHLYTCPFLIKVKKTKKRWWHDKKLLKEFKKLNT